MAYSSSIAKTKRDGSITITDGSNNYIANFAVGDMAWEAAKPEMVIIRDRATIVGARNGDDVPVSFSFSVHLRALHDSGNDALYDIITAGTMGGATLTNVGGLGYEPFMSNVIFTINATALGDSKQYTITFSKCQLIGSVAEGDPSSLSISGTCLGGLTYT